MTSICPTLALILFLFPNCSNVSHTADSLKHPAISDFIVTHENSEWCATAHDSWGDPEALWGVTGIDDDVIVVSRDRHTIGGVIDTR